MGNWRCDVSNNGLDLGDGGPPLLILRFAEDRLLFAESTFLTFDFDPVCRAAAHIGHRK